MALPSRPSSTTDTHGAAPGAHGAAPGPHEVPPSLNVAASNPHEAPPNAQGAPPNAQGAPPNPHGAPGNSHGAGTDPQGARAAHGAPADTPAARAGTEDRGSFTHGTCGDCGWSGPGRRARAAAARDAVRHLQLGCTERVAPSEATPDAPR